MRRKDRLLPRCGGGRFDIATGVRAHDERDAIQASPDELPVIGIQLL
jgi:hypothetical protein